MTAISINDIFSTESGARYRYLKPGAADEAHVISLDEKNPLPKQWSLTELLRMTNVGQWQVASASAASEDSIEPEASDMAGRDKRFQWIEPLVKADGDDAVLRKKTRSYALEARSKQIGVSTQTLLTCLRLYWLNGQDSDALLTKNHLKGRPKSQPAGKSDAEAQGNPSTASSDVAPQASRGRSIKKGKIGERRPYQWQPSERLKIQKELKHIFIDKKLMTRKRIYRYICKKFYSRLNKAGIEVVLSSDRRPSRKQIRYLLETALSHSEKSKRNSSSADYNNNDREKTGSYMEHAVGAGHVYEIDSTIVDLWLVSRANRVKIIGKATLYVVVDRYSRLIVGFHLSLDKPSWINAMEALATVGADKEQLCKRWNAPYDPAAWPADKVMAKVIVADRGGEFMGYASDEIVNGLKVAFQNMPARASALKPICEGTFKLFNVTLKDDARGYEAPANAKKRQKDNSYKLDATLTLEALAVYLLEFIREHNLRIHPGIQLDPELVADGVRRIPAEIWKADILRRSGQLRKYNERFLRQKLLPRMTAKVTQQGIHVNKCYYTCEEAIAEEWFPKAKNNISPIQISFDSRSVDEIYLHIPGRKSITATLAKRSQHFAGQSVAEVEAFYSMLETETDVQEYNFKLETERENRLEQVASKEAELTQQAILHSGGVSRTSNSTEARAKEAKERRQEDAMHARAVMAGGAPPHPPKNAKVDERASLSDQHSAEPAVSQVPILDDPNAALLDSIPD